MKVRAVLTTIAMTIALGEVSAQQAPGPTAEQAYRYRFMVAGFFLRAGYVCDAEGKRLVNAATNFLASDETKAVSKAFSAATERWMVEGANGFNSTVMKDGIRRACISAAAQLEQIEATDKRLRPAVPSRQPAATSADQARKPEQARTRTQDWHNLESDNGAVFRYDLNSVQHYNNGTARMLVYSVEGSDFMPQNLRNLWFDCNGHYKDETAGIGPTLYAPPRSVAGRLSEIACRATRDTRTDPQPPPQSAARLPD